MRRRGTHFNFRPLRDFIRRIGQGLDSATFSGPVGAWKKQLATRYSAFVRREFVKKSRGGSGSTSPAWKPLAPSTLKQRRGGKRRKTRSARALAKTTTRGSAKIVAILRDMGLLLGALTIGAPGNLCQAIPRGVRFGFGGPAKHPKGKATIRDIAIFHDEGKGDLPQREILVMPDNATVEGMRGDTRRMMGRVGKLAERAL